MSDLSDNSDFEEVPINKEKDQLQLKQKRYYIILHHNL